MQIRIAITLCYHQFNEWSKENVKTRTTRSRTRENKVPGSRFCKSGLGILRKESILSIISQHITLSSAKSSNALKTDFQRCIMQITIAITLPYHQSNEWSKEKYVIHRSKIFSNTRTTRSRTREDKVLGTPVLYV
ncbi:hypothetical protein T06_12479 [Trichinella sp. T6]|nr:hypothetical protein T06_12479 [Trichinella sp. T6]